MLEERIITPDLVIYLQADPAVLLNRIHKRGRRFERQIGADYLGTLNEAFNHFFFHYDESPLLIVNTDQLDFASRREHLDDLLSRIAEPFDGTSYYVPTWETGSP